MTVDALILASGVAVWTFVAYRAWRTRADLTLLALVLIVMGLLLTQVFDAVGIPAPSALAFSVTGVLLLLLWPRRY